MKKATSTGVQEKGGRKLTAVQPQPQTSPNEESAPARDARLLLVCKIIGIIITNVLVWLLWKPLGAFTILMLVGYLREPLQRSAIFWSRSAGAVLGLLLGTLVAALVWLLAHFAVHSVLGKCFYGIEGFLGVGYIGYGINPNCNWRQNWEQKIADAQMFGLLSYVLMTAAIVSGPVIWRHL